MLMPPFNPSFFVYIHQRKNRMKLKKIPAQEADRKALFMSPGVREHGRSTVFITCPFCGWKTEAYIWSLAGSGKRCPNEDCRAHLLYGVAIRDMVPA